MRTKTQGFEAVFAQLSVARRSETISVGDAIRALHSILPVCFGQRMLMITACLTFLRIPVKTFAGIAFKEAFRPHFQTVRDLRSRKGANCSVVDHRSFSFGQQAFLADRGLYESFEKVPGRVVFSDGA